jgi:hypothetical protein
MLQLNPLVKVNVPLRRVILFLAPSSSNIVNASVAGF